LHLRGCDFGYAIISSVAAVPDLAGACRVFSIASQYIEDANLQGEVEWQRSTVWHAFLESDLLREAAWVIACSGFREATVRKAFDYMSLCFCDWESADSIVANASLCVNAARRVFDNDRKLSAIIGVAGRIKDVGFADLKAEILRDPLAQLQAFDYIGPTTCWHLAKNLGLDSAKPDRHLNRLAAQFGFDDAFTFCMYLADEFGEQIRVVDFVLWRYAADNPVAIARFR
jgi:hypothetical protein